jgi:hypothetical protein
VSATAGTIFHGTRTPLTVWFSAAWHLTGGKGGIFATELQREMQLGSYQSAWAMLHRYRSLMVRPGRDRLTGDVEVDEAFLGGPEPGVTGRARWARCCSLRRWNSVAPGVLGAFVWVSYRTPGTTAQGRFHQITTAGPSR